MRFIIVVVSILFFHFGFAQSKKFNDTSINVEIPFAPATLLLYSDTSLIAVLDSADNRRQYLFEGLNSGRYFIRLQKDSIKNEDLKEIILNHRTALNIGVENIGPCLFDHPKNYKPKCPKGHYDKIIPILYGLPSPGDFKTADKGKVYLAGCVTFFDCNPHYYCKIHKVSF